jgi:phosphohistidine phosphatase
VTDHDRPLTVRGRNDAERLGRRLADSGDRLGFERDDLPDAVLCSTAARTEETASHVLAALREPPPVLLRRSLYGAAPDEIIGSAMVVGHNPGVLLLAVDLLAPDEPGAATIERDGLRTCALAVVRLPPGSWSTTNEGAGRLAGLFAPPYSTD